ncbi:phBC6A51 family helix-turn-helix protein [Virgibacillus necropolis]|uniref:Homeodomain phBC6A51-type domain-containing protein n=1 Tax=Virgibacillus necropolis TaxID=163877 RepID=A0A221MCG0_9BACI|nr:phBC6A51 family helix-turn-helix protein [Virgibacillus necropolis]ASN05314.1 hypothetical protein CFK40_09960 [Virgibacillus necropolis]
MSLRELEKRLTPEQVRAAELLVENEHTVKGERRTNEQIAQEVGVSRKTLHNWHKIPDFVHYKDQRSHLLMAGNRARIDSQLMRLINGDSQNNGLPSIKSLELWYKLFDKISNRTEIVYSDENRPTQEIDKMKNEIEEFRKRNSK